MAWSEHDGWTETLAVSFREMALLNEDKFIAEWQTEHDGWVERLRAVEGYRADHPDAERYEARHLEEYTRVLILQRNIASNALKAELGEELHDGTRDLQIGRRSRS